MHIKKSLMDTKENNIIYNQEKINKVKINSEKKVLIKVIKSMTLESLKTLKSVLDNIYIKI